jgi:UDP-N-acetylmuramate dehydrogenase
MSTQLEIKNNVALFPYCTYGIGGCADFYVEPDSMDSLRNAILFANDRAVPYFVIGKGSNLLVSDNGYRGMIINMSKKLCRLAFDGTIASVDAGVELEKLLYSAAERGLGGLESLNDIPGTVGGAVFMNAGAFDKSISDAIVSVKSIDGNGTVSVRKRDAIVFAYRNSDYRTNKEIILSAEIRFCTGFQDEILEKLSIVRKRRDEKQPPDRAKSCGSVFKRPPGGYAGTLVEECGFKGFRIGGAKVSEKHANFIINIGGATAADVKSLIETIQQKVRETKGILLEPEVIFLGF